MPKYHNSFVETSATSDIFEHNTIIKICSLTSKERKGIFLIYRGKLKGRKDRNRRQRTDCSTSDEVLPPSLF